MLLFLLSARHRVTHWWDERFHWASSGEEVALALTGHLEEVFVGCDSAGDPMFEIREVRRFRFTRRQVNQPHRAVCRSNGGCAQVRELVWAIHA